MPHVINIETFIYEDIQHKYMKYFHDVIDPFDRTFGTGSREEVDDMIDENSIFENPWGSTAETSFNPEESSEHNKKRMKRLEDRQNGKGEPDRKHTINQSHMKEDMETFMSVLELAPRERDTVRHIMENLDISSQNFGGVKYEKIILTVCSLVSDQFLSEQPDPDLDNRLFLSDIFKELMDVNNMTRSDHRKLRASVREKSDYFK